MVVYKFKDEVSEPIKGRSYVYDLHYHLVWVTKYRNKALTPQIQEALKDKLLEIAKENEVTVEAMEIMPNHVHILVSAKPKLSITVMIKKFKGITGKWLFKEFPELKNQFWHGHIWSPSYYVGSVGQTTEDVIKKYIKSQKERPFK
ncbi:IS200/IS605 family transposase [Ligilactobacillus sp.]|uniref:IS200/IS605 family transposase n=1 Tax=Ligilactobacillus sp. TaxID=2767921 RepID=UPI002FE094B7